MSVSSQGRILWRISPPVIRALGRVFFSLRVEVEAPPPEPPFVMAANHYSHFDPPVIASALDMPIRYFALEDLFGASRLLDWLISRYGAISTSRDRLPISAVRTGLAAIHAGEILGVFPEATRVSHWGTLPPKRGAAWLALRTGVPLVPVAVLGSGRAFGLDNRLRRASVRVVIGKAMPASGTSQELTRRWAEWISTQVERFPESEPSGPRRANYAGG